MRIRINSFGSPRGELHRKSSSFVCLGRGYGASDVDVYECLRNEINLTGKSKKIDCNCLEKRLEEDERNRKRIRYFWRNFRTFRMHDRTCKSKGRRTELFPIRIRNISRLGRKPYHIFYLVMKRKELMYSGMAGGCMCYAFYKVFKWMGH